MLSARCHIRHIGSPGKDARCAHLSATLRPGIGISPTNVGNATVLADGTPAKPIQGAETMQRARHTGSCFSANARDPAISSGNPSRAGCGVPSSTTTPSSTPQAIRLLACTDSDALTVTRTAR